MRLHWRSLILLACVFLSSIFAAGQEQLPFRTAVELALKNSATSGIARSDLQRAHAAVDQVHDFFLPNMVFGSGLGASYGFPLSLEGAAPAIFNINYQEGLLNLAQRENVKAAKADVQVTAAQNADRRNEVIMETALSYIQLDILDGSINVQREQQEAAAKYQDIANQRVQAGLDSKVELTRAKLSVARTKLDIAQAQAAADQLRLRLSQLTGLPVSSIKTVTESIPRMPEVSQDQDLAAQAVQDNPAIRAANGAALAKEFKASAEHKALYPSFDIVAQYAVLSKINNYDQFFQKFQRHNVTAGVAIRFAFVNPTQRATAEAAKFDANKARDEARNVKDQVSADTLKLQRSVQQLAAAREVADLEHQLAQADFEATQAKIEAGGATLKDAQNAIVAEHERYTAYLNSSFELDKAQVQLLRQIGDLESWALGPTR